MKFFQDHYQYPLKNIFIDCINNKDIYLKYRKTTAIAVVLSHIDYPLARSRELIEVTYKNT